jgi:uncharacterized coiled-coil DUF342 family protein
MDDLSSLTSHELKGELQKADEKYQQLCQKRDELNQKAKVARDERNMLNDEKHKLSSQMKLEKKRRDEIVQKMKEHKKIRAQYQSQAKELIKRKREQRGKYKGNNLFLKVEELKLEIKKLQYEQETVPMNPKEEEKTIKYIKEKKKEYEKARTEFGKQQTMEIDLDNLDSSIDQLFEAADKEHNQVVKYYKDSQAHHDKFVKLVDEISKLINESNQKHRDYLDLKKKADTYHQKAVDMRSKVIGIKKEKRERYEQAVKMLEDSNINARKLINEDELDKRTDENLEKLKKDGKVSIGL